jgi:enoyl-CoA hydratase/carnithine racemase
LSGLQVNEADAIFGGLADYFVPHAQQAQFLTQLQAIDWGKTKLDHQHQTMHFCREFCASFKSQLTESFLKTNFDLIRHGVARAKVSGVMRGLNDIATQNSGFEQAAKSLNAGSPTAAAVVFEYMQKTKRLSLREVLALDYVLAKNFQRQHDFAEGVRALLIDKDKLPKWRPAQLADVSEALVAAHFAP